MLRHKKRAVILLASCAYVLIAPIYISIKYGESERARLPVGEAFTYLWLMSERSTYYFGVFGASITEMTTNALLMIRDEGAALDNVEMRQVAVTIDGETYSLPMLSNTRWELDRSRFNGYAGRGGAASIDLVFEHKPAETVRFRLIGSAISVDGMRREFDVTIDANIRERNLILPFYKFLGELLTIT